MALSTDPEYPVAVIGMSITIPGHNNYLSSNGEATHAATGTLGLEGFSDFLENGGRCYGPIPYNRLESVEPGSGRLSTHIQPGSYFPEIPTFDPREFGLIPEQVDVYPHSAKLLVREAYRALFDSGIPFAGCRIGVFVSACDPVECAWAPVVAEWIKTVLELNGPSKGIDADKLTSSGAMYEAIKSIGEGKCDSAVVCAANLLTLRDEITELLNSGELSPDVVHQFAEVDIESGNGEVVVAVVVKSLKLAIHEGNRIYSTVLGSGLVESIGIGWISGPDMAAFSSVELEAYHEAKVLLHQVQFLEISGGDVVNGGEAEIEAIESLTGFLACPLIFGCVKSNVGHCSAGAFLTSLVKCSLMLYKGIIFPDGFPSQALFNASEGGRFKTVSKAEKFITDDGVEIASISDYTVRGACAHFVLSSYRNAEKRLSTPIKSGPYLFIAGGMSTESAEYMIGAYSHLCEGFEQPNIASGISQWAAQMTWRSFGVGDNISTINFTPPVHVLKKSQSPILAVFSGQGPQVAYMGRSLFKRYSVFRDSIMTSDEILKKHAGFSFIETTMLFQIDSPPGLSTWPWPIMVGAMAIIFFQVALYDLMRSFDMEPDLVIGYSMGEVAAMYASGALTHEAVIQLTWESEESFLVAEGRGCMAAVNCSAQVAEEVLTKVNQENPLTAKLAISCFNSPDTVLIAGNSVGMTKFLVTVARRGIRYTELGVGVAAHSSFLDPCKEEYLKRLRRIFAKQEGNLLPRIPVISTVTGELVIAPYAPEYFWCNIRRPVLFSRAVTHALDKYPDLICIEFAPNPVLGQQIQEMGVKKVFPTLRRSSAPEREINVFFESLGTMVVGGVNCLNISKINGSSMDNRSIRDILCPFNAPTQELPRQMGT